MAYSARDTCDLFILLKKNKSLPQTERARCLTKQLSLFVEDHKRMPHNGTWEDVTTSSAVYYFVLELATTADSHDIFLIFCPN